MKTKLLRMIAVGLAVATLSLYGQSHKEKKAAVTDATIPKGAVHIKLRSVNEGKQYFTYSPTIAIPEVPQPQDGLYRIDVNEKGKVAAVTILRGISPNADTALMKELVAWYAKPGPLRVVDVPVPYAMTPKFIDPFTSMRTGLPPGHRENPKP